MEVVAGTHVFEPSLNMAQDYWLSSSWAGLVLGQTFSSSDFQDPTFQQGLWSEEELNNSLIYKKKKFNLQNFMSVMK